MIRKEKLLQTKSFIDNNKLDSYIDLINESKANITKYTEEHHIIPQKYFKLLGLAVDNSKENLVKLSAFNHIYAHYLLCYCTTGKLKTSCINAFLLMTQYNQRLLTAEEQEVIKNLTNYALLREQAQASISKNNSMKFKGRKLTEEAKQKISIANKGKKKPIRTAEHKQHLKEGRDLHSTTSGKKSIYNKTLNKVKFVYAAELDDYVNNGWRLGGKPLSEEAKQKIGKSNSIALKGKTHQAKKAGKLNSGLTFNQVKCIESGQIFNNIDEAKKWLKKIAGIDGGQIKNCCAGARETTGGYHWCYIKDKEEL